MQGEERGLREGIRVKRGGQGEGGEQGEGRKARIMGEVGE